MDSENSQLKQYQCPKCKHSQCEIGEIRTTGGFWTKFFNIQNKKFTSVTCTHCKFTEFYKGESSTAGNVLDFFGN